MSDYIRREDAIDAIMEAENHAFNSFYKGLVKAHKIVADLTPADVVPVVHGKWVDADFCGQYECSECGNNAVDLYDFCPNCGAKMDGERKE